jgi:hypothetical protein
VLLVGFTLALALGSMLRGLMLLSRHRQGNKKTKTRQSPAPAAI